MQINVEGFGGAYAKVLGRFRRVDLPDDVPIRVETLDGGMTSGNPSVGIIIELPQEQIVVLAQTSVKLFQMAAIATHQKYGDMTEGSWLGHFEPGGTAHLTMSDAKECPGCHAQIPGSCKFCFECGRKFSY